MVEKHKFLQAPSCIFGLLAWQAQWSATVAQLQFLYEALKLHLMIYWVTSSVKTVAVRKLANQVNLLQWIGKNLPETTTFISGHVIRGVSQDNYLFKTSTLSDH